MRPCRCNPSIGLRFAAGSLSWENRSVFEHNRRHEDISKLTMPGLVAQKKAFFEEYYKKKAQKAMHLTEATSEETSDDSTLWTIAGTTTKHMQLFPRRSYGYCSNLQL
ncbi:hypothetical protein ACQ4PT_058001 [Festuca glaucescens]